ncbi:MAG TPA: hypothetical protein VFU31_20915 [Candidatus Binatia bacterium]|nr:hypothetical protein [Candidatus Binatia bacterium]
MNTNPDEPAFPTLNSRRAGLSRLEIFTLAAMQGLITTGWTGRENDLGACAVLYARATLAALEKEARP